MEALIAAISWFVTLVFNAVSTAAGAVISAVEWPANVMGIPAEILAAGVLCLLLLALWRAMGGYFT